MKNFEEYRAQLETELFKLDEEETKVQGNIQRAELALDSHKTTLKSIQDSKVALKVQLELAQEFVEFKATKSKPTSKTAKKKETEETQETSDN